MRNEELIIKNELSGSVMLNSFQYIEVWALKQVQGDGLLTADVLGNSSFLIHN